MFLNVSKLWSLLSPSGACIQLFLSFSWLHPTTRFIAFLLSTYTLLFEGLTVQTQWCTSDVFTAPRFPSWFVCVQQIPQISDQILVPSTPLWHRPPSVVLVPRNRDTQPSAGAPNELMTPRQQRALLFKWLHWKYFGGFVCLTRFL